MQTDQSGGAACTRRPAGEHRHPWPLWVGGLAVTLALYGIRFARTGRVWHVPSDWLYGGDTTLGLAAVGAHYAGGLIVGIVALRALGKAVRPRLCARCLSGGFGLLLLAGLSWSGMVAIASARAARDIARAGEPLARAIEQYHRDHGEYPAELAPLVPGYLAAIPDTGYGQRRGFHYYRADTPPKGPRHEPDRAWETLVVGGAPYAIMVEQVPAGTLVYRPTGEYGDLPGGRRVAGTKWGHTFAD
jgi:hypothetical protein